MQTIAWSYMGLKEKWQMIAYTVSILCTHILTSFTTTENSKLYNISAIRTVAQNTILIYSNTFFSFTMYKLKLFTQKIQSTSPKRPQKCMLSGQLEATRRQDWHEFANEICLHHTGAFLHSQPLCLAKLIGSGEKCRVDMNYTCRHTWTQMHKHPQTHTHKLMNMIRSSQWKWPTCYIRTHTHKQVMGWWWNSFNILPLQHFPTLSHYIQVVALQ